MPPKQRVTKEMILEKAFQIASESGIEAVTARSVAKEVGCSIQPIFSQFATMEDLRQETFEYVAEQLMEEVLSFKDAPDSFAKTTMWVLHLAQNRPHLFHLLYLSNSYVSKNLLDVMLAYDSNQEMLAKMMVTYDLEREVCKDILVKGFLLLHGIATMVCTNHMDFSDEQVAGMMKDTVSDIVRGAKERKERGEK